MIPAWIATLEDKHIDPQHYVCLYRDDALAIAVKMAAYYIQRYGPRDDVDTTLYGNQIYHCALDDGFDVSVEPIDVRENNETDIGDWG